MVLGGSAAPLLGLLGPNGSGKSTVIEALARIFADLWHSAPPAFPYCITYSCRSFEVRIEAVPVGVQVLTRIDMTVTGAQGDSLTKTYARALPEREKQRYLPRYIITSTTSRENRLASLCPLRSRHLIYLPSLLARHDVPHPLALVMEPGSADDLLRGLGIRRGDGGRLEAFEHLSDGEQQLALLLGMVRLSGEEEALFLLDHPDAFLSPAWCRELTSWIRQFLPGDGAQVIFSTHSPLSIGGMQREDLRLFQRTLDGHILITLPAKKPEGMGVAGVLTSDIFMLRSTLDLPTQTLVDEYRLLDAERQLDIVGQRRLAELDATLQTLGLLLLRDDPLYRTFCQELARREDPALQFQRAFTPQQYEERQRLIEEVFAQVMEWHRQAEGATCGSLSPIDLSTSSEEETCEGEQALE